MTGSRFAVRPQFPFLHMLLPTRASLLAQVALPILGHFLLELSARKLALAAFVIAYSAAHCVDYLPPFHFQFPKTFLAQAPNVVFALACALSTLWSRPLSGLRPAGWSPLEVLHLRLISGLALAATAMALYGLAEYLRDRRDDAVDLADAFPTHDQAFL
jgi:hypothetical protein